MLKKGDIVTIVRQPSMIAQRIVGITAKVIEVGGPNAEIEEITADGSCGGHGTVPVDCLERCSIDPGDAV